MGLDTIVRGAVSGTGQDVDAGNNAQVALPLTPIYMGGVRNFNENDPGAKTGSPFLSSPETSQDFRQRIGMDTVLFNDNFNATAQNISLWKHAFTTMTMTMSSGFLNVNAAGTSTVSGNYCFLQSWKYFSIMPTAPLAVEIPFMIDRLPVANEVYQFGLFIPTAATDPIDGAYFELSSNGLVGVIRYNSGTPTKTGVLIATGSIPINDSLKCVAVVGTRGVDFWVDDVLYASLATPVAQAQPFLTSSLPVGIQKYNSALVGTSPNMGIKVGYVNVTLMDIASNMTWANQMASCGLGSQQLNGGSAGYPQIQWPNTTVPATAVATNTTAALGAFLGGLFQLTSLATGATDLIIASYLNPLGGVNQTPRTIKLRGIRIDCVNMGAVVATTPTVFLVAVAWGGTALTLAGTESTTFQTATLKVARRQPIGILAFPVGAVIGAVSVPIQFDFEAPLVINPGEYIQVVVKPLIATATASETYQFVISPNLYHD